MKIFSGTSNPGLALKISQVLDIPLGNLSIEKFKDGEILPRFNESVRNQDIYIVQTTDSSDSIIETLLIVDAAKRSGSRSITLINPYFGYARQDKVDHVRSSIGAKVMADILEKAGIDKIMTVDLHASAIQGFFTIPVIHLNGHKIFIDYLLSKKLDNVTILSPDQGGVTRAIKFSKYFPDSQFAMVNKRRVKPNEIHSMELIGDVKDRNVIIIDDISDTLGTLKKSSQLIKEQGAKSIFAVTTHGILSGDAIKNLEESAIDELLISDSISRNDTSKIKVLSCADMIGDAIKRIENNLSVDESNN